MGAQDGAMLQWTPTAATPVSSYGQRILMPVYDASALQVLMSTDQVNKDSSHFAEADTPDCLHGAVVPKRSFAVQMDAAYSSFDGPCDLARQCSFHWVLEAFWPLALSKKGCRLVQKALDVGTPGFRLQALTILQTNVNKAIQSLHGNFVLRKLIELVPPLQLQFVLREVVE